MASATIIRLKDLKFDGDDVLLIVSNRESTAWLADSLRLLSSTLDALSDQIIIGNGHPIVSPDGIEVRIYVRDLAASEALVEFESNKFSWEISRETAAVFCDKIEQLYKFVERRKRSGKDTVSSVEGAHQYLDPSNCPPAPFLMVSLDEYILEDIIRLRKTLPTQPAK